MILFAALLDLTAATVIGWNIYSDTYVDPGTMGLLVGLGLCCGTVTTLAVVLQEGGGR